MYYTQIVIICALISSSSLIIGYDFYKSPRKVIYNLSSYSLIYAIFYFGVPFLNIEFLYSYFGYRISESSLVESRFYSIITLLIFFLLYLFLRKKNSDITMNHTGPFFRTPNIIPIILILFCTSIYLYIIANIGSKLIINFSDRVAAHAIYAEYEVNFKIVIVFYLNLYCIYLLSLKKYFHGVNKLFQLTPLIGISCELLSGGRDLLFTYVLYLFIFNSIKFNNKKIKKTSMVVLIILSLMLFIRYNLTNDNSETNIVYHIYSFFAEFYHTAFTTSYAIEYNLHDYTNSFYYIMYPALKFFLPLLNLFGESLNIPWYADIISTHIGRHFGFAGNTITESYYYWGPLGAVLYPMIIALIVLLHNNRRYYSTGFFFFIVLAINLRHFFRGSFWDNYTSLIIWFFIFNVIFLSLNNKSKILMKNEK
ncbi:O-antigen polymerase [Providencia rettgeri]|uniref:O-antigen polymerase n=1 Tax=Providencia sp. PROV247 TaxID=2949938 RepID=UPI002349ECF6|nr:O-antigen polymerase [Providencia sp. PROV247]